jgi:hypothetical protein
LDMALQLCFLPLQLVNLLQIAEQAVIHGLPGLLLMTTQALSLHVPQILMLLRLLQVTGNKQAVWQLWDRQRLDLPRGVKLIWYMPG